MVGLRPAGIALFNRLGDLLANRSNPTTVRVLPCQTILFARTADDTLRILIHVVALALLKCILLLCCHVALADINSVQFIPSDATVQELLAAGFGIEGPSVTPLHKRHGERPVLVAHEEECSVSPVWIHGNAF